MAGGALAVDCVQLLRLLQLASPTLPVGAYSYSQGLESATEAGVVRDEASAGAWIEDMLAFAIAGFEGPMFVRMLAAACPGDGDQLAALNADFLASRETAELRAETVQMGRSLTRLLRETQAERSLLALLDGLEEPSMPCAWACAAQAFALPPALAYPAYLWAWTENQVMAAVKLVPLGQSAGQRLLLKLAAAIALHAEASPQDDALANFAPGLALASSAHETQYSRLFRS